MIGYKLFRVRKDGTLGSLFINARRRLPIGVRMKAESFPTKGFAYRPFWHVTAKPEAPHLSIKGRQWFQVRMGAHTIERRPASQGGLWYLANSITILEPV